MFKQTPLDNLVSKLDKTAPEALRAAQKDLSKTFRAGLQGTIHRLDLVSREEFEVQSAVLARTREKLEIMEARVKILEEKLGISTTNSETSQDK